MSLLLWLACKTPTPQPEAPQARPSLLLVTLDTTRADAMGAYGKQQAHTPTFDAVAAQGVRFDRAYATVPLTTPSHASMLTGLYPTRHGIHNNGDAILPDSVETLAEMLSEEGYRTAASVSAFVTTATWNLDQGFDAYFDQVTASSTSRWESERPADEVVADLQGWLPQGQEPFFAWAHVYDAHTPYVEHPELGIQDPYQAEIAFVDQQLGPLIEAAEQAAGPGGLAVILIADHGEAFGEHEEYGHGLFVYDSTMRIPFIMRPAKPLSETVVVDQAVSNVDVTPTALGLLGLAVPEGLDGRDLSAASRGELKERGPVYMESEVVFQRFGFHPELAVAEGGFKLIDTPRHALYDLAVDPRELNDISSENEERVAAMHAWREEVSAQRVSGEAANVSAEVIEQLAALGYVSGNGSSGSDWEGAADAKENWDLIKQVEKAREDLQAGRAKEAKAGFLAVLEKQPMLGDVLTGLARAQMQLGEVKEAEETYRRAIQVRPESTLLRSNLAQNLAAQGRLEEGLELLVSVHEQVPGDEIARAGILKMLTDLDRHQEAADKGRAWLAESPDQRSVQAFTGIALVHLEELDQAETLLLSSLEDSVRRQLVHMALAEVFRRKSMPEKSVEHLEQELVWFPLNHRARRQLADLCMQTQQWAKARDNYATLVKDGQGGPLIRLGWAQALFNLKDYAAAREVLTPLLKGPKMSGAMLLDANLLAKEGKRPQAEAAFEAAKAQKAKEDAAMKARMEKQAPPSQQ